MRERTFTCPYCQAKLELNCQNGDGHTITPERTNCRGYRKGRVYKMRCKYFNHTLHVVCWKNEHEVFTFGDVESEVPSLEEVKEILRV